MSQADLDTLVRALAAGRRTAMALRNLQRHGTYYADANDQLLLVQEGILALERLAPAMLAAHVDAIAHGTGILRTDPDGTAERIPPAAARPPAPPAPAAPAPEVVW